MVEMVAVAVEVILHLPPVLVAIQVITIQTTTYQTNFHNRKTFLRGMKQKTTMKQPDFGKIVRNLDNIYYNPTMIGQHLIFLIIFHANMLVEM